MNRRTFITGLVAASFTLSADTSSSSRAAARALAALQGIDVKPAKGRTPTSMVVLLHGFGGNAQSMQWLAQQWAKVLPDTVFVIPNAPEQCRDNTDPNSRQWFATRALDPDHSARVAQIRAVEPLLNQFIDAKLAQYGIRDGQLVIAGISQGAMMALHTAPRRRAACAGVVAYNGMLVDAQGLQRDRLVRIPVLAVHGTQDNVVPFARHGELQRAFKQAGFAVETATYNLGHDVNAAGVRRGADFTRRTLSYRSRDNVFKRFFG